MYYFSNQPNKILDRVNTRDGAGNQLDDTSKNMYRYIDVHKSHTQKSKKKERKACKSASAQYKCTICAQDSHTKKREPAGRWQK